MTPVRDRAVERLTQIIAGNEGSHPRAVALEIVAAMEALGYRPTEARPAPPIGPPRTGSGLPKSEDVRALIEAARGDCDAATSAVRKDDPPRSTEHRGNSAA